MAQIFPKWANKVPVYFLISVAVLLILVVFLIWYYFSPKFTDVGYRPLQPVSFSHRLHAGELKMDCRYCHSSVEVSAVSGVPPTQTCMNCHHVVSAGSDQLRLVRESWSQNKPIGWVRVHNVPDYAYYNHSIHLNAGVGCESCHGNVASMEVVEQKKPLNMAWCLDCHRDPDNHLRPKAELTSMNWKPPENQEEFAQTVKARPNFKPPTGCSGCHR